MDSLNPQLAVLHDIRRMMQRSSRFISLSGLSGVAAGCCALAACFIAYGLIYNDGSDGGSNAGAASLHLKWRLLLLAVCTLVAALASAFFFTWRRAAQKGLPFWDHTTKLLVESLLVPLVTGGLLILVLLQYNEWRLAAPLSLIFYGLALVNGSKYTLSYIRYLGLCEIALGLAATQFPSSGLYFWAFGFGVLHVVYGFVMWWKHERYPQDAA